MDYLPEEVLSLPLVCGIVLVVGGTILIWTVAAVRVGRGLPVVPYTARRPVPWRLIDLLVVASVFITAAVVLKELDEWFFGLTPVTSAGTADIEGLEVAHPLVVLLGEDRSIRTLLFCGLVAVVVAPIAEEFLFRLLLQGWMEAVERKWRRRMGVLRRLIPGAAPVVLACFLFAAMHYRGPPVTDARMLVHMFVRSALVSLLTLGFGVWLVRFWVGGTAADLGFVPKRFFADVRLGVLVFLGLAVPIYGLRISLGLLLPGDPIVDPITLFFLALALGGLYYRTHRIVPSIVVHMLLNGCSLVMAWLFFQE